MPFNSLFYLPELQLLLARDISSYHDAPYFFEWSRQRGFNEGLLGTSQWLGSTARLPGRRLTAAPLNNWGVNASQRSHLRLSGRKRRIVIWRHGGRLWQLYHRENCHHLEPPSLCSPLPLPSLSFTRSDWMRRESVCIHFIYFNFSSSGWRVGHRWTMANPPLPPQLSQKTPGDNKIWFCNVMVVEKSHLVFF